MNTANLQLEGLYVAVTALADALREKGLLSAEEIKTSLDRAETVAWRAASEKDISAANIEAIIFPIRYLRVAVEASSRGQHLPFHEVARIVGETKLPRPAGQGTYIRRDDELRAGGSAGSGRGAPKAGAQRLSEDELLDLARLQEQERDA
jgi:hypothetical protein